MTATARQPAALAERNHIMAAVVGLLLIMEGIANPLLAAAFGFDLASAAHFGVLFDQPAGAVELLRWGTLLDRGGYLAFGVVVIYVGDRLRGSNEVAVATTTASGLGGVVVGGTGAAVLATVGPALLTDFSAATGSSAEAARVALETVGRAVAAGAWGIVTFGLFGGWLIGVGWLLRRQGAFAWVALGGNWHAGDQPAYGVHRPDSGGARRARRHRHRIVDSGPIDLLWNMACVAARAAVARRPDGW
ncbi:MAG: hypothetical protein M3N29_03915 [Chloroflexota bacterium]|nr:hypothetical protein [Chloroflexota bacterium]